jgi:hypothetical protein
MMRDCASENPTSRIKSREMDSGFALRAPGMMKEHKRKKGRLNEQAAQV